MTKTQVMQKVYHREITYIMCSFHLHRRRSLIKMDNFFLYDFSIDGIYFEGFFKRFTTFFFVY